VTLQVGPPVVAGVVVSIKGHYGFAELEAAGAAKLGLADHPRMFFHTSEVSGICWQGCKIPPACSSYT